MTIAPELLRRIVEGALLAAAQPLSEDRLLSLIEEGERPEKSALREALEEIAESCAERGFELKQVASGWRYQVPEDLAPWVNKLWEEKPQKYSRATLETLAIIAYRQPITRGDIEEIRGVAVSSHIVRSLSERGWIKVVGQRDVPGKPSLYATTREFLDYFNLKSLEDLPTLAEIRDIESLNAALDLGEGGAPAEPNDVTPDTDNEAPEAVEADTETTSGDVQEETHTEAADEAVSGDQADAGEENDQQAVAEDYAEEAESPEIDVNLEAEHLDEATSDVSDLSQDETNLDETTAESSVDDESLPNEFDEVPESEESPEQEAVNDDENKSPENLNS
ncbi:SMC-Scp complex subunit ScpB [uncultured Microbulbifer sp.]|uniref:SMC-Scp complex subunit ScpB n=1 Tax=uncultured Microbulbifer sp. TaxID=348147 RepID=UPI002633F44D|nr:SMC-Scp complex subunit ScpB [uncultured Microbulbifer sp.]